MSADVSHTLTQPAVARHLDRCAECRAYGRRLAQVEEGLRAEPGAALSSEQLGWIEATALQRIRQHTAAPARAVRIAGLRPSLRAAGALAAAAAVLIAAYVYWPSPSAPLSPPTGPMTLAELMAESEPFTQQIPDLMRMPGQSLQTEMDRLSGDARRAVAFLLECAPSQPFIEVDNEL